MLPNILLLAPTKLVNSLSHCLPKHHQCPSKGIEQEPRSHYWHLPVPRSPRPFNHQALLILSLNFFQEAERYMILVTIASPIPSTHSDHFAVSESVSSALMLGLEGWNPSLGMHQCGLDGEWAPQGKIMMTEMASLVTCSWWELNRWSELGEYIHTHKCNDYSTWDGEQIHATFISLFICLQPEYAADSCGTLSTWQVSPFFPYTIL